LADYLCLVGRRHGFGTVEVGELATAENNGVCLCWLDIDTGTLTAEGATDGPGWRRMLMDMATRLGCRLEVRA
jgi:hypothetical protein